MTGAGEERRRQAQGAKADALQAALRDLDGRLADWADDFIFGEVWDAPGISAEEQMLVAITALAATGRLRQLRNYLHGALQAGIPEERLRSAVRMLVVYAGFPVAIDALGELQAVCASRRVHS
jgi:4-carboxymuconolactone decarboxylase